MITSLMDMTLREIIELFDRNINFDNLNENENELLDEPDEDFSAENLTEAKTRSSLTDYEYD